jgi:hypothetical protein
MIDQDPLEQISGCSTRARVSESEREFVCVCVCVCACAAWPWWLLRGAAQACREEGQLGADAVFASGRTAWCCVQHAAALARSSSFACKYATVRRAGTLEIGA